jgi:hypothetical protein
VTYPSNGFPFFSGHTDHLGSRGHVTFGASIVITVAGTQKLEEHVRIGRKGLGHLGILCCQLLNEWLNESGILPDNFSELLDLGVGSQSSEIGSTHTAHTAHTTHTTHSPHTTSGASTSARLLLLR